MTNPPTPPPPFTLRIFSHTFQVITEDPTSWAEDGLGRASLRDQTIRLSSHMAPDTWFTTLLHEAVHLISDASGAKLSEQQVEVVSLGLFTLLRDNPGLLRSSLQEDQPPT